MALKAVSFIFALALQCSAAQLPALSTSYVTGTLVPRIRSLIQTWPTQDKSIAGGVLRLSFHDCAGDACDGCVNTSLPDNAGLDLPVTALEWLYGDMKLANNMSRADLWALAGTVVVYDAIRKNKPAVAPPYVVNPANFRWGRTDCPTGPQTDTSAYFPSAAMGSSAVRDYFLARFSFNASETVAIMGAHHIGRMHKEYSGFNGGWAPSGGALDGSYYTALINKTANWHQKVVNCSVQPSDIKVQWVDNRGPPCLNMLDSDIGLYKDVGTPQPNGAVSCTFDTCQPSATSQTVEAYAANKLTFVSDFSFAFNKMIRVCSRTGTGAANICDLNSMVA